MRTRHLFLLLLPGIILAYAFRAEDERPLEERLSAHKQECKDLISPARYEGSRTTYFNVEKRTQRKRIEVVLLESEYVFAISGKECSAPVNVRFYDSGEKSKRTLISELRGIHGGNHLLSSQELNIAYHEKLPEAERLRNLFVEYEIGPGEEHQEGIVFVIGSR